MSFLGKDAKVRAALERVWHDSRPEAMSRLALLERFLDELRLGRMDKSNLSTALSAAHRLSGALGMFGMDEGSACAAEIEALLGCPTRIDDTILAKLVRRLREVMEKGPDSTKMPGNSDR